MIRRFVLRASLALVACVAIVYVLHQPFTSAPAPAHFEWLALRGVHQTFHRRDLDKDTCTAERIDVPRHDYLENTLPSIAAALDAGATMVELDVHRTADDQLAVWHDWTVDCRTEGSGQTKSFTLAELQSLDAGYGYTADGGQTYPFRGKHVGAIPALEQVLATFPQARLVINQKDRSLRTTERIAQAINRFGATGRVCLMARAGSNQHYLSMPGGRRCALAGPDQVKRCLFDYLQVGWLSHWPGTCDGIDIVVPDSAIAHLLWGWPGGFIETARANGSRVLVLSNDPQRAAILKAAGVDGIITNQIERMPTNRGLGGVTR